MADKSKPPATTERRIGDDRRGPDRRKKQVPVPVERRSGKDRRSGADRRDR